MVEYIKIDEQTPTTKNFTSKVRAPIEMFGDEMLGDKFYKHIAIPYFKRLYKDLVA